MIGDKIFYKVPGLGIFENNSKTVSVKIRGHNGMSCDGVLIEK